MEGDQKEAKRKIKQRDKSHADNHTTDETNVQPPISFEALLAAEPNAADIHQSNSKFGMSTADYIEYISQSTRDLMEEVDKILDDAAWHDLKQALNGWDENSLSILHMAAGDGSLKSFVKSYEVKILRKKGLLSGKITESYPNRENKSETPPAFIERVYGSSGWLNGEFTRADLRKIDPKAVAALEQYENKRGKLSLEELNLPTKAQLNDRRMAAPAEHETPEARLYRQRIKANRRYDQKRK